MLASQRNFIIYICMRNKSIFPTTMLAYFLPFESLVMTVYNEAKADNQC